ncbi:unnamed protein product, partial [Iphiclides podalirius]
MCECDASAATNVRVQCRSNRPAACTYRPRRVPTVPNSVMPEFSVRPAASVPFGVVFLSRRYLSVEWGRAVDTIPLMTARKLKAALNFAMQNFMFAAQKSLSAQ